ncbi:MAG: 3-phosphoserine/phosphohydroxythreonine transaminase [Cyanobacteria bacterium SZAS LIN-2]|nr:3-phosphoserine/phosphohydroxythreonine transaminase [Cyanobacteria bacterium SZAS LIN-2]
MSRPYNFSAGPGALPEAVLERAAAEMTNYAGSGMSVMEMSHRGKEFLKIAEEAEADLRDLMGIPANYKVLFLQGGAMLQFSAVPLNLAADGDAVDYLSTGYWSDRAVTEAKRFCQVSVVASGEAGKYTDIPARDQWKTYKEAEYFHYCANETIHGVEFHDVPDVGAVPLVCDMSSTILSRPVDVSKFGLIYAGAQKNIGPAGLTVVIVRDDLLDRARKSIPYLLSYKTMAENGSMANTPPTYAWYMAGLVFKWVKEQGGLAAMAERNRAKSSLLYKVIDESGFYSNPVKPECRSWMNVPFVLADSNLEKPFLEEAKAAGLLTLAGHRSVGGMRASLYNAMPIEGVEALTQFMLDFARRHG